MFKKLDKRGFTLAELLIVVAIIGVLVAISIPIFTAQLEKARDATTIANIRSAYAEAQASYLTEVNSDSNVTVSMTDGKVSSIAVANVAAAGTQAGGVTDADLPFNASNLTDMESKPGKYTLTFTYGGTDGALSSVTCAK